MINLESKHLAMSWCRERICLRKTLHSNFDHFHHPLAPNLISTLGGGCLLLWNNPIMEFIKTSFQCYDGGRGLRYRNQSMLRRGWGSKISKLILDRLGLCHLSFLLWEHGHACVFLPCTSYLPKMLQRYSQRFSQRTVSVTVSVKKHWENDIQR